jgi:large subunit ribosomal protein L28
MAKVCFVTGKHPVTGGKVIRRGQSKKSGGIGQHIVSVTKRKFRPNLQHIRVVLPSGQVKRVWVSTRAIKSGKIQKA